MWLVLSPITLENGKRRYQRPDPPGHGSIKCPENSCSSPKALVRVLSAFGGILLIGQGINLFLLHVATLPTRRMEHKFCPQNPQNVPHPRLLQIFAQYTRKVPGSFVSFRKLSGGASLTLGCFIRSQLVLHNSRSDTSISTELALISSLGFVETCLFGRNVLEDYLFPHRDV